MYTSNKRAVSVSGARFMPCSLTDDTTGKIYELSITEPKLKTYRKFEELSDDSSIKEITGVTALILSKNREGIEITADFIEDNMTLDEIAAFYEDFVEWISENKKKDPN